MNDQDGRAQRLARNEALAREINERIAQNGPVSEVISAVCECSDADCMALINVPLEEYGEIRHRSTHFIVAPGHESLSVEVVISQPGPWLIVEKIGEAAAVVRSADSTNGSGELRTTEDLKVK